MSGFWINTNGTFGLSRVLVVGREKNMPVLELYHAEQTANMGAGDIGVKSGRLRFQNVF